MDSLCSSISVCDVAYGVLGVVDRRAQRLGVGLLEVGTVPQLDRPVLGAFEERRVEVVDGLDALAQDLERLLGLARLLDGRARGPRARR